jgi:LacI family transcriptional regulator
VIEAVGRLDIPVVTLDTDLPASKRVAHVGVDHAEAGATAAYLIEQWLADRAGDVLVVRGDREDRRVSGFRAEMTARAPNRRLLEVHDDLPAVLAGNPSVRAVYSLRPAANPGLVAAFDEARRNYDVFVAHDLDAGNLELLQRHRLSAVLHHDPRADLRQACLAILRAQGALPGPIRTEPAPIRVITPPNVPAL